MSAEHAALSYSAGQDSFTLLLLYLNDASFRATYAPKDYVVAMSDTGAEHPTTIEFVAYTRNLCDQHGIEFVHITPDMGYHTGTWKEGHLGHCEATGTITSSAFPNASCTDQLKIAPWYKWYNDRFGRMYGYPTDSKKAIKMAAERSGKAKVQIGFSIGEESRAGLTSDVQQLFDFFADQAAEEVLEVQSTEQIYMQLGIEKVFPLIDLGFDRQRCQEYIQSMGHPVPDPSLCVSCHWKSDELILWTSIALPEEFARWEQAEAQKLVLWDDEAYRRARQHPKKFKPDGQYKNCGVGGRVTKDGWPITLGDRCLRARRKLAHLNDDELFAYLSYKRRWNGHGNKSKNYAKR